MKAKRLVLAWGLAALLTACAGTVTVSDETAMEDPRPVFLLDHGRHSSLVLTRSDQSLVRYVYGDWRWYAKRETGAFRVFPTLFARTQAAFGRRELSGPPDPEALRRRIRVVIEEIHPMSAPGERIDGLAERLDGRFESARDTLFYNEAYDLEFVHDPNPYTLGDNSNHVVAGWLEELGIEIRGNPVFGRWRVERP